ncbi:hypothetical protein [Streptomyces sp. NPDC000410]|uniref:hypothetical protein n=1 Tax=Streptomyces sp. NPDC000410 TaxID=3154254 RepID=UPI003324EC5E
MSRTGSRLCSAFVVLLVGLLLCTGATGASAASEPAPEPSAITVSAGHEAPGCDEGTGVDGGLSPATPPRGSSAYELLPAPHAVPAGAGCWAVHEAVPDIAPERGPPPVAAPSPMDLSVLRV